MSDRGAPAATSQRRDEQGPWRGVGMREGGRVHDDPGHQVRGDRAAIGVDAVDAEPLGQQRDHLARRGGCGIDPVRRAAFVVRGMVVDDHPREPSEKVRVTRADVADAVERAAIEDDQQVIRSIGIGIGPDALDAGHEVVDRGHRVGADRIGGPAERLDQVDDPERGTERVRVGVLVADRQDAARVADAFDDDVGHGRRMRTQIDVHREVRRPPRGVSIDRPAGL